MAPKLLKTLTLVLALATFVGTATLCVHVPTAIAATGTGGCTNGDPDSPKDTSPKQTSAQPAVMIGSVSLLRSSSSGGGIVRWVVVQEILNSLFGSPGLMR